MHRNVTVVYVSYMPESYLLAVERFYRYPRRVDNAIFLYVTKNWGLDNGISASCFSFYTFGTILFYKGNSYFTSMLSSSEFDTNDRFHGVIRAADL